MRDERFRELVNLYLDKEIAREDLAELREELKLNRARRTDFEERCRLHQAMGLALKPKASASSRRQMATPVRRARSGASRASSKRRRTRSGTYSLKVPLLVLGSASLAAFTIAAFVFNPVVREILSDELVPGEAVPGEIAEAGLDRFDSERYESGRGEFDGASEAGTSSLTAQLRLAGLGPETSPVIADLKRVVRMEREAADTTVPELVREMEMDLYEGSSLSVMDGQSVISGRRGKSGFWPEGFQSSLVSY